MMRNLLILFAVSILFSCQSANTPEEISSNMVTNPATASGNKTESALPEISFEHETHDFGKIIQGEKVSYTYKFTNTGDSDLIITKADGSCGCTLPKWPKEPIPPGEDGVIEVIFNSEGKKGIQNKRITLVMNTIPNKKELFLKAEVIASAD
ncbi:MAG: hypothetical protein COC01_05515 [Bacteroidetes bacterium]|nr:MAG: hypothetical protein COC01_05515 [Bacteroidota bacterium]